jgi:hypothetical protein
MTDFSGCVASSAKNLSVEDEPSAHAGAERKKNKMLQTTPSVSHAEVKLCQGSGIAIVLDQNRDLWEFLHQALLQSHMMPAR